MGTHLGLKPQPLTPTNHNGQGQPPLPHPHAQAPPGHNIAPTNQGQQPHNGKRAGGQDHDSSNKCYKAGNGMDACTSQLLDALYKLKQSIVHVLPNTPLMQVLWAGGNNLTTLMHTAGVPKDTCCRLTFWGWCGEPTCPLLHDPITLTPEVTKKVVALLQPGANKQLNQQQQAKWIHPANCLPAWPTEVTLMNPWIMSEPQTNQQIPMTVSYDPKSPPAPRILENPLPAPEPP